MSANEKQSRNLDHRASVKTLSFSNVDKVAFPIPLHQSSVHKASVPSPLWAKVHETPLEKANVALWQSEILHHMDTMAHMKPAKAGYRTLDSASSGYVVIHFDDAQVLAYVNVFNGMDVSLRPLNFQSPWRASLGANLQIQNEKYLRSPLDHGGEHKPHVAPAPKPDHGGNDKHHIAPAPKPDHSGNNKYHAAPTPQPDHGGRDKHHVAPVPKPNHGGEHKVPKPDHGGEHKAHVTPVPKPDHGGDHKSHVIPVPTPDHGGEHKPHVTPVPKPDHGGNGNHHIAPAPKPDHDGEHKAHVTPVPKPDHDGEHKPHVTPAPKPDHGGDHHHQVLPMPPPEGKITLDRITSDNVINRAESQKAAIALYGSVSGDIANGSLVTVNVGDQHLQAKVEDGHFKVFVSGSALVENASDKITASVVASNLAGDHKTISTSESYTVHDHLSASISLTPIRSLSLQEAEGKVDIHGHVNGVIEPKESVTISVDGHDYQASVSKDGNFTVSVKGSELWLGDKISATVNETDQYANTATATTSESIDNKNATFTMVIDNASDMVRSLVTLGDLKAFQGDHHDALWHLEHPFRGDGHANWQDAQTFQIWVNPLEWLQTKSGQILDDGFLYSLTGHYITVTRSELEEGIAFFHPSAGNSLFGKIYDHIYDSSHLWIRAGDDSTHSDTEKVTLNSLPYAWNEHTQVQVAETLYHFLSDKTFNDTKVHLNFVYNGNDGKATTEHLTINNVDGRVSLANIEHAMAQIPTVAHGNVNHLIHHAESLDDHGHNIITFSNVPNLAGDHGHRVQSIALNPYYQNDHHGDSTTLKSDVHSMLQPVTAALGEIHTTTSNHHHLFGLLGDESHDGKLAHDDHSNVHDTHHHADNHHLLGTLATESDHHLIANAVDSQGAHLMAHDLPNSDHTGLLLDDHHGDLFANDHLAMPMLETSAEHPHLDLNIKDVLTQQDHHNSLDHLLSNIVPESSRCHAASHNHSSSVHDLQLHHHTPQIFEFERVSGFEHHDGFGLSQSELTDQMFHQSVGQMHHNG